MNQSEQALSNIRASYQQLLSKYADEAEQIENIDDLFTKFRNLRLYEIQYDKHQELKKELTFWNNPSFHTKNERQLILEGELHRALASNQQSKSQVKYQSRTGQR